MARTRKEQDELDRTIRSNAAAYLAALGRGREQLGVTFDCLPTSVQDAWTEAVSRYETKAQQAETRLNERQAEAERIANSDRAKVKRAFAALRKAGFAVSVNEPSYESAAPTSFAIAEAQFNGDRYAYVSRNRWNRAFEKDGPRWRTGGNLDDTLTHDLNINWGPDTDGQGNADPTTALAIKAALDAEGLNTEWTSQHSTVTVKATAE